MSLVSGAAILQTDEALCAIRLYAFGGHPGSGYRCMLLLVIINKRFKGHVYIGYYRVVPKILKQPRVGE